MGDVQDRGKLCWANMVHYSHKYFVLNPFIKTAVFGIVVFAGGPFEFELFYKVPVPLEFL